MKPVKGKYQRAGLRENVRSAQRILCPRSAVEGDPAKSTGATEGLLCEPRHAQYEISHSNLLLLSPSGLVSCGEASSFLRTPMEA